MAGGARPNILNSIDIFLLPSHWEGFGYVIGGDQYLYDYKIDPTACSQPLIFDVRVKSRSFNKVFFSKRTELVGFFQQKNRT